MLEYFLEIQGWMGLQENSDAEFILARLLWAMADIAESPQYVCLKQLVFLEGSLAREKE